MAKHRITRSTREKRLHKIKVTKNGPYLISGSIPLTDQVICLDAEGQRHGWREEQRYLTQENYSLCRCGRSKARPFCDSTHSTSGFDGTETADHELYLEQADLIEGPALQLTDKRPLCAHAGFCDRSGGVWNLTKGSADPEARKKAIEEACDCPSGRLVAWDTEGEAIEPRFEPSIGIVEGPAAGEHGPIWVRGNVRIESAEGTAYETRNRVTLCRCGRSANKPFCDGSHRCPALKG
ncbi:MAG: CDGSH iron-sulfur domain-containing protein [Chloroflexi bacterium]|nr:CDGSH iron-sulfur domain-containing protein [Chloroflexota bacterium]